MKKKLTVIFLLLSISMLCSCGTKTDDSIAGNESADTVDNIVNSEVITDDVEITSSTPVANYSLFGDWLLDGSKTEDTEGVIYTFNEDLTGHMYFSVDEQYDFTYTYDETQGLLDISQEGYAVNEYNYSLPDETRLCIGAMIFYRQ